MSNLSRKYPTEERRVAVFSDYAGNARVYCESRAFSVERVGQFCWSASFGEIPKLDSGNLASILGVCALFPGPRQPRARGRQPVARGQGTGAVAAGCQGRPPPFAFAERFVGPAGQVPAGCARRRPAALGALRADVGG
eukprot:2790087-Lingulodinium_polyedra.AAC.1